MASHWVKNLFGLAPHDDASMKDIPCPKLEMAAHVTLKNVQAGALIGSVIVGPICAYRNPETRNEKGVLEACTKYGIWGVSVGALAAPLMTGIYVALVDSSSVYDGCYSLRNHEDQIRVDQGSVVGTVVGSGLTAALGHGPAIGGLVGMSVGVIGMALYNNVVLKINLPKRSKED